MAWEQHVGVPSQHNDKHTVIMGVKGKVSNQYKEHKCAICKHSCKMFIVIYNIFIWIEKMHRKVHVSNLMYSIV